jgi:WD40 repeat protein
VFGVAFSPDGKLLAATGGDGTVWLWNPATGHAAGTLLPAGTVSGPVSAVAFSPDGKLLAAAYSDGYVRLWNPATRQAVAAPLPATVGPATVGPATVGPATGVNAVAFSPDSKLLASADADGTLRTWPIPLFTNPYTALCADVGPLTKAEWKHYAPGEPQPREDYLKVLSLIAAPHHAQSSSNRPFSLRRACLGNGFSIR